ncbi:unnamed protein product [Ectocarpus sp. CCAP 1310/34]|nr:unnamed protein product [Ectocarpus sp. CCAP 1310/34]
MGSPRSQNPAHTTPRGNKTKIGKNKNKGGRFPHPP